MFFYFIYFIRLHSVNLNPGSMISAFAGGPILASENVVHSAAQAFSETWFYLLAIDSHVVMPR